MLVGRQINPDITCSIIHLQDFYAGNEIYEWHYRFSATKLFAMSLNKYVFL